MANGWNMWVAMSALHKALRHGDVETAAYAAAWLSQWPKLAEAAWRRVCAFPAEDLAGEGAERVAALHHNWVAGHEDDNLFAAILYLCELVKAREGALDRRADELKCAALYWVSGGRQMEPPSYAEDVHTGGGTLDDWWGQVNALAPASPWREDAMRYNPPKKEKAQASRQVSFLEGGEVKK
ncbi:MAG: hypothetical protein JXA21_06465 [Anaerolineae bacterium]|nr:hypothetical protein [Anaerolineae bacterium]